MTRKVYFAVVLAIVVALLSTSTTNASTIVNGDFSQAGVSPDPFAGWTTFFGDLPTDDSGVALFNEGGPFSTIQLEQTFNLPANALSLSFDYLFEPAGDAVSGENDSFQAILWDEFFQPISDASGNPFLFPAFYSIDRAGQTPASNTAVLQTQALTNGWTQVTLDVSSVAPQFVTLDFQLNGRSDGYDTAVRVDNVILNVENTNPVPEPSSFAIFGSLFAMTSMGWIRSRRRTRSR
jgi:hypothetical protein